MTHTQVTDDLEVDLGGPTWRDTLRANRGLLVIGVLVVVVAVVLAIASSRRTAGALDPDGVDPGGSHALATLLAAQGVTVVRVTDARAAAAALGDAKGEGSLLVVPTATLSQRMRDVVAAAPRQRTVLLGPDPDTLSTFAPWAEPAEPPASRDEIAAACSWAVADRVGTLPAEGPAYRTSTQGAQQCWNGLVLDDSDTTGSGTTVVGPVQAITNARLADSGYAALGLNVLGHNRILVWWLPSWSDPLQFGGGDEKPTIEQLVPSWVGWFVVQLAIAVVVVVWWRGRRMGRVVVEPLPVVVRATETVEGRARLYRRGQARGRAADALRASATDRLRARLALPRGASLDTVVAAASAHTGRPTRDIAALLTPGSDPKDDAGLTGLADALDILENEVRRP